MRLIRRVTLVSIILFAVLIIIARVIGSGNKPPALAMLDPGNCPQPCWHGIQPGITTVGKAVEGLSSDVDFDSTALTTNSGRLRPCWRTASYGIWRVCIENVEQLSDSVSFINLWPSQDGIRLGDAINVLGDPLSIYSCPANAGLRLDVSSQYTWSVFLVFRGSIRVTAYKSFDLSTDKYEIPKVSPYMMIRDFSYYPDQNFEAGAVYQTWRGFTRPSVRNYGCGP
jgi:hypothetical protein